MPIPGTLKQLADGLVGPFLCDLCVFVAVHRARVSIDLVFSHKGTKNTKPRVITRLDLELTDLVFYKPSTRLNFGDASSVFGKQAGTRGLCPVFSCVFVGVFLYVSDPSPANSARLFPGSLF
jgi:hypothetical protein